MKCVVLLNCTVMHVNLYLAIWPEARWPGPRHDVSARPRHGTAWWLAGPSWPGPTLGPCLGLTFGTACRPDTAVGTRGPTWPVWQPANITRPSPRLSPSQTLILISKDSAGRRLARSPSARAEKGSAAAARLQPSLGADELLSARLRLLPCWIYDCSHRRRIDDSSRLSAPRILPASSVFVFIFGHRSPDPVPFWPSIASSLPSDRLFPGSLPPPSFSSSDPSPKT